MSEKKNKLEAMLNSFQKQAKEKAETMEVQNEAVKKKAKSKKSGSNKANPQEEKYKSIRIKFSTWKMLRSIQNDNLEKTYNEIIVMLCENYKK